MSKERDPVAWIDAGSLKALQESTGYALRYLTNDTENLNVDDVPLYLAPPQREPLCRHLIDQAYMASNFDNYYDCFDDGIKFAEKVHGIGADDE